MFRREAGIVVLVSLSLATVVGAQTAPARSDQEILIQLERDWDTAFLHKDLGFIDHVLADEFMVTYDDGSRGDKAKELATDATFDRSIESSMLSDFTVKEYGEIAVVWFSRLVVGRNPDGRRGSVRFQLMDVFVWRADRWQCVASQSTKVAN